MKRITILLLLMISFSAASNSKKPLIYSAHPEFAPMSWEEQGKLVGVGPEIVEIIFSELNIPYQTMIYPWKRVFERARAGHVDVIASLYFNEARSEYLTYSEISYAQSNNVLVTRKGAEFPFNQWSDLIGRKGGAISGDSWGEKFDRYIENHLVVKKVTSYQQAFRLLLKGRIDYVIISERNARILAKQFSISDKVSTLPTPVNTEKEYAAFSNNSPYLDYFPEFNQKLKQMVESGEVERIIEKYINKASGNSHF